MQKSVLFVCYDEQTNKVAKRILESNGCLVFSVTDGKKAAQLIAENKLKSMDLIVLDVMVPFINGIELLKRIRNSAKSATVPILMMCDKNSEKYASSCMAQGAQGYVAKPILKDSFLREVSRTMGSRVISTKEKKANSVKVNTSRWVGPRKNILIVDDNRDALELLFDRLEMEGFQVDIAYDGEEGLQKVSKTDYKLVILDIMMPGLDGFEVLSRIKRDEKLKKIPVVMSSACSADEDLQKGKALGAIDYVVKPYKISNLLSVIRKYS